MTISAWFIGSSTLPIITAEVGGASLAMPAGTRYLRSATASLSLLDAIATAASTLTGDTHTLVVLRNRHIQWSATGGNWDVDLSTGNGALLATLLGATLPGGSYTGASTYTFEEISPLLWSPGYMATPTTPEGFEGYTVPQQSITKSADGEEVYCDHYGEEVWNEFAWTHIMPERLMQFGTTAAQGGTFHQFHLQCAMLRARFLWHEEIDEDDASATAVTWDTAKGPYVLREEFADDWYKRNVPFAEVSSPLELPVHRVAELS